MFVIEKVMSTPFVSFDSFVYVTFIKFLSGDSSSFTVSKEKALLISIPKVLFIFSIVFNSSVKSFVILSKSSFILNIHKGLIPVHKLLTFSSYPKTLLRSLSLI